MQTKETNLNNLDNQDNDDINFLAADHVR